MKVVQRVTDFSNATVRVEVNFTFDLPFRIDLVFDQKPCRSRLHIPSHSAPNIDCIAEPGICVRNDGNVHNSCNRRKILLHLFVTEKPCVGHSFRGGRSKSGHEGKIKIGTLDDLGGQSIPATWHKMDARFLEEAAELASWSVG